MKKILKFCLKLIGIFDALILIIFGILYFCNITNLTSMLPLFSAILIFCAVADKLLKDVD